MQEAKQRNLIVLLILALGSLAQADCSRSDEASSIPSTGGVPMSMKINGLPYYLQNDPRWAKVSIGGSNEPLAHVGCTLSCVAAGLAAFRYDTDPERLCAALKNHDGFTDSGLLKWEAIESITDGHFAVGFPALSHKSIDAALNGGSPVITKIMLNERIIHWVLIVGKEGLDYLVMDPLNQRRELVRLSERSSRIFAIRLLQRG